MPRHRSLPLAAFAISTFRARRSPAVRCFLASWVRPAVVVLTMAAACSGEGSRPGGTQGGRPAMKGLRDSDYYQQTSAPKGTITDVDFTWDASKNPTSGPPQRSQQAVSPEVPAGYERMQVYTPPGYDPKGTTRYPVLYLNHGTGDTYKVWLATAAGSGTADRNPGYGARIYENLLNEGKTVPMIIVTAYI